MEVRQVSLLQDFPEPLQRTIFLFLESVESAEKPQNDPNWIPHQADGTAAQRVTSCPQQQNTRLGALWKAVGWDSSLRQGPRDRVNLQDGVRVTQVRGRGESMMMIKEQDGTLTVCPAPQGGLHGGDRKTRHSATRP